MKKKKIIILSAVFILAIMTTLSFLNPHYSIDTIEFSEKGFQNYINSKFLVDGRIFSVILLRMVINMPMKYVIPILYVIGLFISSIAVMYVRNLVIEYGKLEKERINIIPTIISYVIVFNFMYVDSFQFIEFPIIAISVLLYIIGAKLIIEKNKNYILKSIAVVIIAMFCYQGTISVLIVTAFVLSIIKHQKINKPLILDMLKIGIILIIAIIINYSFTLIIGGTSRLQLNRIDSIKNSCIQLYFFIFDSGSHYPKYLQLIFVIIIIGYCIVKKISVINILLIYFISMSNNIFILLTSYKEVSFTQYGRIYFSIGALIGYVFMYIWCTNEKIRNEKIIKTLILAYFISILITYSLYTYFYMEGQRIDSNIISSIEQIITDYENESGEKVKYYGYEIDVNCTILNTSSYYNLNRRGVIYYTLLSGRNIWMSFTPGIYYIYTGRMMDKVYVDENEFNELFEGRELTNEINKNRFVFVGDMVYFTM